MFELIDAFRHLDPHRAFILAVALLIAFGFELVNGFHDTANAVTTVNYTRTLRPMPAVFFSGFCNFLGVVLGGTAIAFSIVHLLPVDLLIDATSKSAIIMVLALAVAFAPHGGNVADAILTAITMGFLAALAWMVFVLGRQNQLTLATLTDKRRAILYAALGMLTLLIAGSDELFSSGGGTLLWIILLGASVAAIWRIWVEASSY